MATALSDAMAPSAAPKGFYRFPALHADHVWFTAEGDLWRVSVAGGRAERITSHPDFEQWPAVSPDGRWLAFVAAYEGPTEVYAMPAAGGAPVRLTWDGQGLRVWGFTPDSEVLYSGPSLDGRPDSQLHAVHPVTRVRRTLPVGQASDGAVSADGRTLYFTRGGLRSDNARAYRGGALARLWRLDLAGSAEAQALVPADANARRPMPYLTAQGPRIAFLSDRDGRYNLWSVNARGGDLRQHTRHKDWDIRQASLHGSRVAYALGADLFLHDLGLGTDQAMAITLGGDFDQQRTRWVRRPQDYLSHVALAPDGERIALTLRGQVITQGTGLLRRIELQAPPLSRCRQASFSADGRHVYAICDGGPRGAVAPPETEIWRLAANGLDSPVQMTHGAQTLRLTLSPSPDGKWLAHADKNGQIWLTELQAQGAGSTRLIAAPRQRDWDQRLVWSPDSRALAWTRPDGPAWRDRLYLYHLDSQQTQALTSDRYETRSPAFTPDGKWLYFLSDRHFAPLRGGPWGDRNLGPYFDRRTKVYALALQAAQRFPFLPRDELEPAARAVAAASAASAPGSAASTAALAPIQSEGLAQRLYEVPLPPGNYRLLRTDGKRLYVLEEDTTPERRRSARSLTIDNIGLPPELFAPDVRELEITPDGKRMLVWRGGVNTELLLLETQAKLPPDTTRASVHWAELSLTVEPLAEWRQIFDDAWRLQRDFFYDPGLHGVDWAAVRRRYEPLVSRLTDRAELNELLAQMVGELGLLHSQVFSRDLRSGPEDVGLAGLGARFSRVDQGWRIDRIWNGDPELPAEAAPLAATGLNIAVGDIITAINGRDARRAAHPGDLLRGQAGHQVLLAVQGAQGVQGEPGGQRSVVVVPVDASREARLRLTDWEAARAARAAQASAGKVGYLRLRAMLGNDIATFAREFYAQLDREALVIDVRGNNGGSIDSWIIEKLLRRVWAYWQPRSPAQGVPFSNMQDTFRGHLAVLIDENTYSDGETFAEGIRRLKLGTLVGRRTAGAGVWLSDRNRLVDNGLMRAAENGQFAAGGGWLIEGQGVAPDIEVDNPPRASFAGGDAQLDAAVAHLLKRLTEQPLPPVQPPAYPRPMR